MYDLIIIGAGLGGIALAAEAHASGVDPSRALILEKGTTHNWAIRQLYPEQKLTTANYKGFEAKCEGLLCISDMTKSETLEFFDKVIQDYQRRPWYFHGSWTVDSPGRQEGLPPRIAFPKQ